MKKTLFLALCSFLFLAACSKTEEAKEAAQPQVAEDTQAALPSEYGDCKLIGEKFASCEPFVCAAHEGGIIHKIEGVHDKRCVYAQQTLSEEPENEILACDLNRQDGEKMAAYFDGQFNNPEAAVQSPVDEFLASGTCFVPVNADQQLEAPSVAVEGEDALPESAPITEAPSVQP